MALLQLIVMISMTVILNLQHSGTLQQSKQRSRSDFKFMNTSELIAGMIISFHDDNTDFVFTSDVISLVTVLPQLAHTVVTGSLSKTTLAIAEPLSCTTSTSKTLLSELQQLRYKQDNRIEQKSQ